MKQTYHIYNAINKRKYKKHVSFHMPGHKGAKPFNKHFPIAPIDVTELAYSDDLQHPTGCIAQAQQDLANIVGAKKSYIVTDGSSCAIMAMLHVAKQYGSKIIVPRNSHKSVYNACYLMGLEPIVIQGEEVRGVMLPPSPDLVTMLVLNDVTIAGMIALSPDYYGNIAPLQDYAEILHANGKLLLVDGAHGGHLVFEDIHCGKFADMWVDGAHKSLPTLTQGALLSVGNEQLCSEAEEALSIFRTTSPSYPIMASVEYGFKYMAKNQKQLAKVKTWVKEFKEHIVGFAVYPSLDWTKLVLDCKPTGISTDIVQRYLEKKKFYCEMNDGRYLVFYLSIANKQKQFKALYLALIDLLGERKVKDTYVDKKPLPRNERTYSYLYALKQQKEWVDLDNALGCMSAGNCGITPPCIPVIVAGDLITQEAIDLLKTNKNTFGVQNGKVLVVKR